MKTLLKAVITFHTNDLPEGMPQSNVEYYESLSHVHDMVSMHTLMAARFYNRAIYQTSQKFNPLNFKGEMHFSFEDATPFMSVATEQVPYDPTIVTVEQRAKQLASNLDQIINEIIDARASAQFDQVDQALAEIENKGQTLPEYSDLMERVKRNLH